MKKLTDGEKTWLMSFICAIIVSFVFYIGNRNGVYTHMDAYLLEAGIIAPFLFPLYMFYRNGLWRSRKA